MKLRLICILCNQPQDTGISSVRTPAPSMYICVCHGFTDGQVRDLATRGCRSVAEVYRSLSGGEPPQCGKCVPFVREMVRTATAAPDLPGREAAYAVAAE
jgi:bacterioferritin-associated ferredoxin